MYASKLLGFFLASTVVVLAAPYATNNNAIGMKRYEALMMRASETVNPNAITDTTCGDPNANIVFHDQNVALLSICGGIAGTIEFCGGNPKSTIGASGTAIFTLTTTDEGATINISKGRWEGCIRAARAVCPTGAFSSTCIGGASTGNVAFTLAAQ